MIPDGSTWRVLSGGGAGVGWGAYADAVTTTTAAPALPDGLVAVVKRDCPTCALVDPVLAGLGAHLVSEDDDAGLETSYRLGVETVPTLLRIDEGVEQGRVVGWSRDRWEALTGVTGLAPDLPDMRPGCGSRTLDAGIAEALLVRFEGHRLRSRRVEFAALEDEAEAMFDRGWTDGLPVVAPTESRVLRMLTGTGRDSQQVVAVVPPNLVECTVEKVAINAVMAGCKPEYMPVVLGVLEAALDPLFTMHGLLCTTHFSGPLVIINGPIAKSIGMNSGVNALGQGNRANATIGRALQLIVRNVGGGIPGAIDRATLGNPGKYTFCFAEDESDPTWEPLAQRRGIAAGRNAVTLFHGEGVHGFIDQKSRTPEELVRSLAMGLFGVGHPKLVRAGNAVLVLTPEHYKIFKDGGWSRRQIEDALYEALKRPGKDLVYGAQNVAEGVPESYADKMLDKFDPPPDGVLIVRAGGPAGLFSAIIGGWPGQRVREECQAVTREIRP